MLMCPRFCFRKFIVFTGFYLSFLPLGALAQSFTGHWTITENVNATACGEGTYDDSYGIYIDQSDVDATLTANNVSGSFTLNFNTFSFSLSFPEDGGTTTANGSVVINGESLSGNSNWSWSGFGETCAGTSTVSGYRLNATAVADAPLPEFPKLDPSNSGSLGTPQLSYTLNRNVLTLSWDVVSNAQGYILYYAPYPDASPISTLDLGASLGASGELPTGSAFYIAVAPYNSTGEGPISNIEHFSVAPLDIIEVANKDSDIGAIIYGNNNTSVVVFNETSTSSDMVFEYPDGSSGQLTSDTSGRPIQYMFGDYRFDFVYTAGMVRTTMTEPGGAVTVDTRPETVISGLSYFPLSLTGAACGGPADCNPAGYAPAIWDDLDVEKLEQLFDRVNRTFQRISGTVGAVPWELPVSVSEALDDALENYDVMAEKIKERGQGVVKRIGNALNCASSPLECAGIASLKMPVAVKELETIASSGNPPTGSFDIDTSGITPTNGEWHDYFVDFDVSSIDAPCSESAFAAVRPACGGTVPVADNNQPDPGTGAWEDRNTNLPVETVSRCDPLTSSTYFEGCYNAQGKPTGWWKTYGTSGDTKHLERVVYNVNGKPEGYSAFFRSDGTLYKDGNYVNGVQHGTWTVHGLDEATILGTDEWVNGLQQGTSKAYYTSGKLKSEGNYVNGIKQGPWNYFNEYTGQVSKTITYSNGVPDIDTGNNNRGLRNPDGSKASPPPAGSSNDSICNGLMAFIFGGC